MKPNCAPAKTVKPCVAGVEFSRLEVCDETVNVHRNLPTLTVSRLSKLQRQILRLALSLRGKEDGDLDRCEIFIHLFGWQLWTVDGHPVSRRLSDGRFLRYGSRPTFSGLTPREKNSANASVSRSLTRLQNRGLLALTWSRSVRQYLWSLT